MQKQIFLGTSKFPTIATISEHVFGSFVRTFYEFEYSRGSDPEVYKFRGSNIDYCLHGHSWLVCCNPKVVIPEEPTSTDQDPNNQTGKDDTEILPNQVQTGNNIDIPPNQTPLPGETLVNSSGDSDSDLRKSSVPNDQLVDDPAEFIRAAPLFTHFLTRLQAHQATEKYNVDLELLLPGSKRPRKNTTPPRPPNSFMVYSMFVKDKDNLESFLPARDTTGSQTNAQIGSLWNALPMEDKEFFTILAEFAKHLHHQLFPNYVYRPSKKPQSGRRKRSRRTKSNK